MISAQRSSVSEALSIRMDEKESRALIINNKLSIASPLSIK